MLAVIFADSSRCPADITTSNFIPGDYGWSKTPGLMAEFYELFVTAEENRVGGQILE